MNVIIVKYKTKLLFLQFYRVHRPARLEFEANTNGLALMKFLGRRKNALNHQRIRWNLTEFLKVFVVVVLQEQQNEPRVSSENLVRKSGIVLFGAVQLT